MEGVVVKGDRVALVLLPVEGVQHFVQQLPTPGTGEDQVAVLQAAAGFLHDVHRLVQPEFQMRFFGQQRIVCAHNGAGPRVDGDDAVVFRNLLCKGKDFVLLCVSVGFVHEAEGSAERAAFHGLAHIAEFLLNLLLRIWRRVISGHPGADGALADQRYQVHKKASFGSRLEFRKAARMLRVKQAAADFVPVGRVGFHTEGRKTAVSGNLRGNALFDKRFVELFRILAVIEEIIVRMGVNQPRADGKPLQVNDPIRFRGNRAPDFQNTVVFD